ncbi:hypothetical protein [Stenoxybacter acetivorans]|uniref:hypothetical protein n=1 Tax=Stenoxybacter acetivorans TaxID=422441 RepID=UPI000562D1A3|nr:hypothetical protein [Stenoxybacter acetivorans]
MLSFLKRNHDFLLLLIALVTYISNLHWFPFLFAMILYVWYRRELLWRVRCEKPFYKVRQFDQNTIVIHLIIFFLYGFILVIIVAFLLYFLGVAFYISYIFEYTFKYLYTGFHATEAHMGKNFMFHRYLLVLITLYAVYFGRKFLLSPWYECFMNSENKKLKLLPNIPWVKIILRNLLALPGLWILCIWTLFQVPLFIDTCSPYKKMMICINIGENFFFLKFLFRYLFWWSSLFLCFWVVISNYIHRDNEGISSWKHNKFYIFEIKSKM